jgi:hypothetical protein
MTSLFLGVSAVPEVDRQPLWVMQEQYSVGRAVGKREPETDGALEITGERHRLQRLQVRARDPWSAVHVVPLRVVRDCRVECQSNPGAAMDRYQGAGSIAVEPSRVMSATTGNRADDVDDDSVEAVVSSETQVNDLRRARRRIGPRRCLVTPRRHRGRLRSGSEDTAEKVSARAAAARSRVATKSWSGMGRVRCMDTSSRYVANDTRQDITRLTCPRSQFPVDNPCSSQRISMPRYQDNGRTGATQHRATNAAAGLQPRAAVRAHKK